MSMCIHNYHRYIFGGPIASSHSSNWELGVDENSSSIWQKLRNFINVWLYLYYWMNTYAAAEEALVKKHLGNDMPNVVDIMRNMSVLLVNDNPLYGYVKPEPPNVVFFNGFHINKTIPPSLPRVGKL